MQGIPNSLPYRTVVGFKWELSCVPNTHQKCSWWGGKKWAFVAYRSEAVQPSWPPFIGSVTEHLQQINFPWCAAAPLLHADRVLSICCLSSQVHAVLSASCHSTYDCRLSKSFTTVYKMDLQSQSWHKTSMLNSIHCPDEKLNLALPARKARYRTSKDSHPFKSHNFTSPKEDWVGKSLLWNAVILNIYTLPFQTQGSMLAISLCYTFLLPQSSSYNWWIVLKWLTRTPSRVVLCKDFFLLKEFITKHLFQKGCQLLKILSHARCKAQKNVM